MKIRFLWLLLMSIMLLSACAKGEESASGESSSSSVIEESVAEGSKEEISESSVENTVKKHKLTVENGLDLVDKLENEYAAGEKITLKLYTYTEHYFVVTVNGEDVPMNREDSDLYYTYFYFTMPDEDAVVVIEDVYVDIPEIE